MTWTRRKNINQGRRNSLFQLLRPWLARLLQSAEVDAKTPRMPPYMIMVPLSVTVYSDRLALSWLVRARVTKVTPDIR